MDRRQGEAFAEGTSKPEKAPTTSGAHPTARRRGRPRKAERAFSDRQIIRDVLAMMELEVEIKIGGKAKKMPIIQGILYRMMLRALEGEPRMILEVVKLRQECMRALAEHDGDQASFLEQWERRLAGLPRELVSEENWALLNHLRAQSRKV
jgi:hypothetical protein